MTRRGSRARKGRKKKPKSKGLRFWENSSFQICPTCEKGKGICLGCPDTFHNVELYTKPGPKPFVSQYENDPSMNIPQMTPKKEEETK